MVLCIVPDATEEVVRNAKPNEKVIDYRTFNSVEIHPFIATTPWDGVKVVVGRGIVDGYLKQVVTLTNQVTVIYKKGTEVTYEIIKRLQELLPNNAPVLRKMFLQKQDIVPYLMSVGVIIE